VENTEISGKHWILLFFLLGIAGDRIHCCVSQTFSE